MPVNYGSLPFLEQLAFFRAKLNLPTQKWDDLLGAAHDRAFVVAGATQADLLMDLRNAVDSAIANGTTLEQFRKEFNQIVANRGWTGWTGQGTKAGEAWRTRVIYDTNLFTSYAAGRYQQMQEVKKTRPYWRWRHSPASVEPRPEHLAWDGKVLSADDPWWSSHYPPCGFGCKCYVETLSPRDLAQQGLKVQSGASMPYAGTDPKTGLPNGVDRGWDYAPGESVAPLLAVATGKLSAMPRSISAPAVASLVQSDVFQRWIANPQGNFPLVVLPDADAAAIGAKDPIGQLSSETVAKQRKHHPELTPNEYAQAQQCVDQGERIQDSPLSLVYVLEAAAGGYVTVVKATKTGESVFVTSFRRLSEEAAKRDSEVRRLRRKKT